MPELKELEMVGPNSEEQRIGDKVEKCFMGVAPGVTFNVLLSMLISRITDVVEAGRDADEFVEKIQIVMKQAITKTIEYRNSTRQ